MSDEKQTKKYYWIKLYTDFYSSNDKIDYLMSQANGSDYVVLYQLLCLNTANKNGKLAYSVGEMLVPYDVPKIVRDCKYFGEDTVVVALSLYKKLGLIYEEQDGTLQIANFDDLVGCESKWAGYKRAARLQSGQALDNVQNMSNECPTDVQQEIDKEKDKEIDKDLDINIKENHSLCECQKKSVPDGTATKRFVKPTVEEIATYCAERSNKVDAQKFFDYYESNGWKVGRNSMKDWKAAVRTWEKNGYDRASSINASANDDDWMKTLADL